MAKKILVIDDEPDILLMVQSRLRANGFQVATAGDGENALGKIKTEIPDLILLDIVMPKMDGFAVLSKLKADAQTKKIPVIMFSAKGQTVDVSRALSLGASDYILKPFEPKQLLEKMNKALAA